MPGTPANVRVGPGWLFVAALGSAEPTDLATPWDYADWIEIGYTDEGPSFNMDQTFENVMVAEELDPVATFQTERNLKIVFAAAELTARNLQLALNGGTINVGGVVTTFEPPATGDYTHVMIGWEATDHLERWIFRKCLNTGAVEIPRRRAPDKAVVPMEFQVLVPAPDTAAWVAILDNDYAAAAS